MRRAALEVEGVLRLSSDLSALFASGLGTDITLLASDEAGGSVKAHKAVLAARCDVLRAMWSSGMREATQDMLVIEGGFSAATIRLMVQVCCF